MIEMNWQKLRDYNLSQALNSLARQKVPYKTTVKIMTLVKALEAEQKKADAVAAALRDRFFQKVEREVPVLEKDGSPKVDGDGKPVTRKEAALELKDGIKREEVDAAEKEFAETKARFKLLKLKGEELEKTELTAVELFALDPFIDAGDEVGQPRHLAPVEGNA